MQFQIEVMFHSQNHTINIHDEDFALYLYRNSLDTLDKINDKKVMVGAIAPTIT